MPPPSASVSPLRVRPRSSSRSSLLSGAARLPSARSHHHAFIQLIMAMFHPPLPLFSVDTCNAVDLLESDSLPPWAAGPSSSKAPVSAMPTEPSIPSYLDYGDLPDYTEMTLCPADDLPPLTDASSVARAPEPPIIHLPPVEADPSLNRIRTEDGSWIDLNPVLRRKVVKQHLEMILCVGNDADHPEVLKFAKYESDPEGFRQLLDAESIDPALFRAGYPSDCVAGWHGIKDFLVEMSKLPDFAGLPTRPIGTIIRWLEQGITAQWVRPSEQRSSVVKRGLALLRSAGVDPSFISEVSSLSSSRPPPLHLPNHASASAIDSSFLPSKLADLEARGIICPARPLVTVPLAVVQQPTKNREIMDARYTNIFDLYPSFHYEHLSALLQQLQPNSFVTIGDLKAGYNHFFINPSERPLFGLQWAGETFEYNTLCFGRNSACFEFTAIMTEVYRALRVAGWRVSFYIDDHGKASHSLRLSLFQQWAMHYLFKLLGLVLNRKGNAFPSQQFHYLGFDIDTRNMSVRLPEEKLSRIEQTCNDFISRLHAGEPITQRELARLAGFLLSAAPALPMAKAMNRALYDVMSGRTWDESFKFEEGAHLHISLVDALTFWRDHVRQLNGARWKPPATAVHIRTDASDRGGGLVLVSSALPSLRLEQLLPTLSNVQLDLGQFPFSTEEAKFGSAVREAIVMIEAAQRVLSIARAAGVGNFQVRIDTDSMSAAFGFNRLSFRNSDLQHRLLQLYLDSASVGITFVAVHIPRELNAEADHLSRTFSDPSDFVLSPAALRTATSLGKPGFDLFASRASAVTTAYATYFPDAATQFHDALSLDWSKLPLPTNTLFWIFPPTSLISSALSLLHFFRVDAIVVLPPYFDKPWQGLLASLPVQTSLSLGSNCCRRGPLFPRDAQLPMSPFTAHLVKFSNNL